MLDLPTNVWKNIRELDQVGWNTVEALMARGGRVRVTARRDLKRDEPPFFYATYEEQIEVGSAAAVLVPVWTHAIPGSFPSASGDTAEDCLRLALHFVDESGR